MIVATLFTNMLEYREPGIKPEGGFYELDVHADEVKIAQSHSPRDFVFKTIGLHLGSAIQDTGVPREHWYARFPEEIQRAFNLPSETRMSL